MKNTKFTVRYKNKINKTGKKQYKATKNRTWSQAGEIGKIKIKKGLPVNVLSL
jgi:hypothetical protein